ncbi:MAG TPA: DinB family protein [Anaerolineales bacterium]|nr:DinB family protein [Anaerolineales bacterium]
MLDYSAVARKEMRFADLVADLTFADVRRETIEMYDCVAEIIAPATDRFVTFQPTDPQAWDEGAASEEEKRMAWTLAHVVVHLTASNEEAAFLAAELARGVERAGRSRIETHWMAVTTAEQLHARFAESRRMVLACLDLWPDTPNFNTTADFHGRPVNCVYRHMLGLKHNFDHLEQLREIMRQVKHAPDSVRGLEQ